ncbi:hypothetical protein P5673_023006 [Acropora cervicornis]|uniref:Uncharacterized protein n=1 Tax=Acropora cervicornis TaxID=6130 RepID=A0AAD9Q6S1_ACRCE|nr:hypothetical protein P5673_023006 [Acropora cervicornis]
MSVAICCYHFKHTVVNGQQRYIKGSTTKIKHQDILFSLFLVHTISNCSSRGLVNDSHNIETSNGSSILGGLTLGIIEIGRHCDNSMSDFLAKVGFCNFLKEYRREFDAQCHNHGTDFFSSKCLLFSFDGDLNMRLLIFFYHRERKVRQIVFNRFIVPCSTDEPLGIKNRIFWIGSELIFCSITDESFAFRCESHVRWSDTISLIVRDDFHPSILKYTHTIDIKKYSESQ